MKQITKLKLATINQWCKAEEKSFEYVLQVMQDMVKVEHHDAVRFFTELRNEHEKLEKEVNDLLEIVIQLEDTKL
jgi:hypothetical protein